MTRHALGGLSPLNDPSLVHPQVTALSGPTLIMALVVLALLLVPSIPLASASQGLGAATGARPAGGIQAAHDLSSKPSGRMPAAAPTYLVEFDETGLTAGTSWYVNLTVPSGVNQSTSVTSAVTFSVVNGTYSYLIENPVPVGVAFLGLSGERFVATTQTIGQVTVNGKPSSPVSVNYKEQFLLGMTPNPAAGGSASPGITYEDVGSTVLISAVSNPGYVFTGWTGLCFTSVAPFFCTGSYTGAARQAFVTMNGTVLEAATFAVKDYAVTFHGIRIPSNVVWNVTFNGTTQSGPGPLLFSIANGTYNYSVGVPVQGPSGVRFTTLNLSGTVPVQGANVSVEIPFTTQYFLHVAVSAQGGGTITPSSQWYDNGTQVTLKAIPSAGFAFTGWNGTGGPFNGEANSTVRVTMSRAVTEVASFGRLYPVTLQESGLPLHTEWSVSSGGQTFSANATGIAFNMTNGTYGYTLGLVPGYHPTAVLGNFSVLGEGASVNVTFHIVTYGVAFIGKGGGGGSWSITVGTAMSISGPNDTVNLLLPNGTYSWTLQAPSGYQSTQTSGVLVINGENETRSLTFNTLPPNGLLGVGESASYAIIGGLLAVVILVVGLWLIALNTSYRTFKGSPTSPERAKGSNTDTPPVWTGVDNSSASTNSSEPAKESGMGTAASGETVTAVSPASTSPKAASEASQLPPTETPKEAPTKAAAETPKDAPKSPPVETSKDSPVGSPNTSPAGTPAGAPPKTGTVKSPIKGKKVVRDPPA